MDAESAAAERLAALASLGPQPAGTATAVATPESASTASETKTGATATLSTASEPSRQSASQPLVLAALVIALVIAAVAAVKLARAGDESVFAGADDAAATLALPVVGVIPAVGPAWAGRSVFDRYRSMTILGQMLLAVAIFALVAYCVQNPSFLWELCTDPARTLRGSPR
jgi:hypothetical protein